MRAAPPTVADVLEGPANSLTYWTNPDGSVTVTMLYTASREDAQRVFIALMEHGVDIHKKDED